MNEGGVKSSRKAAGSEDPDALQDPLSQLVPQAPSGGLEVATLWVGIGTLMIAAVFTAAVMAPDLWNRRVPARMGVMTNSITRQAPTVAKELADSVAETQSLTEKMRRTLGTAPNAPEPNALERSPFTDQEASTASQHDPVD